MPAIPPTSDFNKSTIDKDTFHAKFLALHAYLTGLLASSGNAVDARSQLGLGSAATVNTGTAAGNVPVVGSDVSVVQAGAVAYFAMSTTPAGWLKANGALVSRTTYAALFAVIGTTYGAGDGVTTFALPDLRGEFLRGFDDGRGVDLARVFGSAQQATSSGTGQVANETTRVESGATDTYSISLTAYAFSGPYTGTLPFIRHRPRNVAMLACIKY